MKKFFIFLVLAQLFSLCAVEKVIIVPRTLTEIRNIKEKIATAKVYSADFRKDSEKYYIALLDGNEKIDDYISFYESLIFQAPNYQLKTALIMRHIRGLLRITERKNEAVKKIRSIDLKSIVACKEEISYNKLLQTYTSDNFDKAKSLYEDAIKSYKECSASDFELSVLYNNLALLYEEKDTKKAGELYCNAIMSTLIPSRIGLYVSNLSDLMKKDTSVQKSAVKIITDNLGQLNGDKKIILLQSLINYGFFDNDERMKRKYLDILSMLAKNCPTPRIKSNVLLTLALEEQTANNYADAKDLYMECISIAIKEKQSDILIRAKIYSCSNSRRMGNKIDFPKLIQNIISYISSADEPENDKAFWYATLAMEAVYRNEWSCFDKLTDLSNKTDGGVAFARKASLYWVQNASDKTNRDSYIRIAKKISDAGIKDMPAETKSIIALHLSMMGNTELSKRFTTPSNINFHASVMEAERLISIGTSESTLRGLQILKDLKPSCFEIAGNKFSEIDANAWRLTDILGVYITFNDLTNVKKYREKLEKIIPQCSEQFMNSRGFVVLGQLGSAYIVLGLPDRGVPILSKVLPEMKKGISLYPIFELSLGLGYMQMGDSESAEKYFREASKIFRAMNSYFGYARATVNLALAMNMNKKNHESSKVLDEIIPIMQKLNLSDDLARAYQIQVLNIITDNSLKRAKKIKRIDLLRQTCIESTTNPTIIAHALFIFTLLKNQNNFPVESIVEDIELYFKYQQLFSDAIADGSLFADRDAEMRKMLFNLLAESNNVQKIDYWNKVFEKKKTRSIETTETISKNTLSKEFVSLISLVEKHENATQIIEQENLKPENRRDKNLLSKAVVIKREIEQQFEAARKNLPQKDLDIINSLLADNFVIHPDSLGQLSAVIPEGVACVQYLLADENVIVYMVAKDTPPFMISISLKDKGTDSKGLVRKIVKVRTLLQGKSQINPIKKEMNALYSILFAELESSFEKLKIKKLIVNGSGTLRYIPIAALYDGNKYLVEKYQVTNVTGLDLIRLTKNTAERSLPNVKATIFADPDGTLPAGRAEGKTVSSLFANAKLYVGNKASLKEFEAMYGDVNFIHLATHAVLDPNNPGKSYIQFADGKKWYYSDMMGFNIKNVDSIALSACSTAMSEKSTGGEIEGMAYQLLKKSPSGSVLASFWKVDDTATAILMGIYYKHVTDSIKTSHTLDRGGALREAQLNLLNNPDTCHPYYWAAFTLFGDFR